MGRTEHFCCVDGRKRGAEGKGKQDTTFGRRTMPCIGFSLSFSFFVILLGELKIDIFLLPVYASQSAGKLEFESKLCSVSLVTTLIGPLGCTMIGYTRELSIRGGSHEIGTEN